MKQVHSVVRWAANMHLNLKGIDPVQGGNPGPNEYALLYIIDFENLIGQQMCTINTHFVFSVNDQR